MLRSVPLGLALALAGLSPHPAFAQNPSPPPVALIATVAAKGAPGKADYSYVVVARTAQGLTVSATASISDGNRTLNTANYNDVAWSAVPDAVYDVYRIAGGDTQGRIAITATRSIHDTGLPADGDSNFRQVLPFMDSTFVGLARGHTRAGDEWTFDADIVPNFVVHESLFRKLGEEYAKTDVATRTKRVAWSFTGVPMVRLRLFINEPSAPVKTPSYMPKGTFQLLGFQPGKRKPNTIDLYAFQATVGHHSNGQDGCLYVTETGTDCTPPPGGITPTTQINTKDGSFSTNYLLFGGRYRFVILQPEDVQNLPGVREGRFEFTVGGDLELNPGDGNFLGGAGIDPDQKALYGPTRVSGLFNAAARDVGPCYRLEGKSNVKYIHGQLADGVSAFAEIFEGLCLFRETGWGLMARFYNGQDYYNAGFGQNMTRLQIGLTYSQEGFLRFRLR